MWSSHTPSTCKYPGESPSLRKPTFSATRREGVLRGMMLASSRWRSRSSKAMSTSRLRASVI